MSVEELQGAVGQVEEILPVEDLQAVEAWRMQATAGLEAVAGDAPGLTDAVQALYEAQERAGHAIGQLMRARDAFIRYRQEITGENGAESAASAPAQAAILPQKEGEGQHASESLGIIDDRYAELQETERAPGNPAQVLNIGPLTPDAAEYQRLIDVGISPADLEAGHITRGQLLEAGFFFLNRLGGGSKRVFSDDIPVVGRSGEHVNFSDRVLLTREEVETVYRYQQQHPDIYGFQGHSLDDVRRDMLLFTLAATKRPAFTYMHDFITTCFPYEPDMRWDDMPGEPFTEEEWRAVGDYWKAKMKQWKHDHPGKRYGPFTLLNTVREEFAQRYCADLFVEEKEVDPFGTRRMRGVGVQSLTLRRRRLLDQPSPFLESNAKFALNLDACIYFGVTDIRADNQFRINAATIHLLGGHADFPGLTEMGGAKEQVYMTPGAYIGRIYPTTPETLAARQQELTAIAAPSEEEEVVHEARRRLLAEATTLKEEKQRNRPWWRGGG